VDREFVLERLRAHERVLRAAGVQRLSLFGSVARGDAHPGSDIDLAAVLDHGQRIGLFRLQAMVERIEDLLGVAVDLITEPVSKPRLQERIERDRIRVF
jgi:hypothetical protein